MAAESKVTVVFLVPTESGGYKTLEFPNVTVNAHAPIERIKPALLSAFPEADMGNPQDVDIMVQALDGSNLSNVSIQDQSRIVLFPKYTGPLVKR